MDLEALFINPLADTITLRVLSAGLYFIVGLLITVVINNFLKSFVKDKDVMSILARVGIDKQFLDLFISAARYYMYFILLLLVLGRLGISSMLTDILVFVMIISVVIIGLLALKNIIPNAAAGIYISSMNVLAPGDEVSFEDISGKVVKIELLNTVLDSGKDERIIIPNSLLLQKKLVMKGRT